MSRNRCRAFLHMHRVSSVSQPELAMQSLTHWGNRRGDGDDDGVASIRPANESSSAAAPMAARRKEAGETIATALAKREDPSEQGVRFS